jgi:hypothetical protein
MSFRRLLLALPLIVLVAAVVSACGARADLTNPDQVYLPDSGLPDGIMPPPPTCGDGMCNNGETCENCPIDCGFCMGCGDGMCTGMENCLNCPQDCGSCPTCGDGKCENPPENCVNCPQDCGVCQNCGNGMCTGAKTCYNCPQDCGKCMGCPDGNCNEDHKTCISCPEDCGPCAVCGNGTCEKPYETCVNCPQDCGMCPVKSCFQAFTCAIGCIDLMATPPSVSVSCVANCVAEGCPATQYFFDQAFNCILDTALFGDAGCKDITCFEKSCQNEINACLGATCSGM